MSQHPRFRAAYDFLVLRGESGEAPQALVEWWARYQEASDDAREAMLDQVQRGWAEFSGSGRFRSAQLNVRLRPEDVRELFRQFVEAADKLEDDENDPLLITFFSHPHPSRTE